MTGSIKLFRKKERVPEIRTHAHTGSMWFVLFSLSPPQSLRTRNSDNSCDPNDPSPLPFGGNLSEGRSSIDQTLPTPPSRLLFLSSSFRPQRQPRRAFRYQPSSGPRGCQWRWEAREEVGAARMMGYVLLARALMLGPVTPFAAPLAARRRSSLVTVVVRRQRLSTISCPSRQGRIFFLSNYNYRM